MIQNAPDPFPESALDANRSGILTDDQRQQAAAWARARPDNNFVISAVLAIAAVVLLRAVGPASLVPAPVCLGVGAVVFVFGMVLCATYGGRAVKEDLEGGRVEIVEGALIKRIDRIPGGHSTTRFYYFEVSGRTFKASRSQYDAAPDGGIVRLFVLPRSRVVVNMEQLPDRPLPEGAFDSPVFALRTLATAVLSQDSVQAAEARATIEAMKHQVAGLHQEHPVPPPLSERDPRPLSQAVVGRWRTGPVSVEFTSDGTVTLTMPGGQVKRGHWSVDASGRLHSDAFGQDQAAEAWVAGDTLTVAIPDGGATFHRA